MSMLLDHTVVRSADRLAAARFFADVFGLEVGSTDGHFAQVRINDHLTFDFADDPEIVGSPDQPGQHYAFLISEQEFDEIFARVQARGIAYGSEPFSRQDGQINTRRGGRGFYFDDPDGHILEVMTVPETGSR